MRTLPIVQGPLSELLFACVALSLESQGGHRMKRKIVLPLAMAVAICVTSVAMIVPAQAGVAGWVGPFPTWEQCDNSPVFYVTVNGDSGWDLDLDGRPDFDWVSVCGEYSGEYWYAYGDN